MVKDATTPTVADVVWTPVAVERDAQMPRSNKELSTSEVGAPSVPPATGSKLPKQMGKSNLSNVAVRGTRDTPAPVAAMAVRAPYFAHLAPEPPWSRRDPSQV